MMATIFLREVVACDGVPLRVRRVWPGAENRLAELKTIHALGSMYVACNPRFPDTGLVFSDTGDTT